MAKQLKYQTKDELMATAKAAGVKGVKVLMTKATLIQKIEEAQSEAKKKEAEPTTTRKGGEY